MSNSIILEEFLKIAENKDLLGLKKEAAAEKNPYQEELKTIEEKRLKSPDKSIIEEAHPEPVFVAESRGEGGLVENEIEHQKKVIEMLNKMPTGSLVGRYAVAMQSLVKFANTCDILGYTEAANLLTEAAVDLGKLLETEQDKYTIPPDLKGGLSNCTECYGKGTVDDKQCQKCGGSGLDFYGEEELPFAEAPID